MFKNNIRTYFRNLKFIWVSFLIFFSFLAIGLSVLFFTSKSSIEAFIRNADSLSESSFSYADYFKDLFSRLDFRNHFLSSIRTIFSIDFFQDMFLGINGMIEAESHADKAILRIYEGTMERELQRNMLISYGILFLGIYLTDFFTRFVLYRKNIKKKLSQSLFSKLIDSLLISSVLSLAAYFSGKYALGPVFSYLIMIFLQFFLSLLKSLLVFSKGKVRFSKAVNMKNVLTGIFSHLFIHLLTYLIFLALYFLFGPILSFLCFVPLYCYSKNISNLSLDLYIDTLRHEKKNLSMH